MVDDGGFPIQRPPRIAEVRKAARPHEIDQAVNTAFAEMAQLRLDRDEALAEKDRAHKLCREATSLIDDLKRQVNEVQSRCISYQIERDQAVAKFAKLEGFLASLNAQMTAYQIPKVHKPEQPTTDGSPPTHDSIIERIRSD